MTPTEARAAFTEGLETIEGLVREAIQVKEDLPAEALHPALRQVLLLLEGDLRGALRRAKNLRPFLEDGPGEPV